MLRSDYVQIQRQKAQPSSALKCLDRLVGTWNVSGEAEGQVSYEWIEDGLFLMQRVDLDQGGQKNKGIEIIRYDEETGTLRSVFFTHTGKVLEYEYEMEDDTLIISMNIPGVCGEYIGTFSADGRSYTGSWEWSQDGRLMGYDTTMTRLW
jgi:hypothetical protein